MSSDDVINSTDFFFREVPSVKITNTPKPLPSKRLAKEELQILRLSKKIQENIMETLKYIHGEDFELSDATAYTDRGANLPKSFWKGRSNLFITNTTNYSDTNKESENNSERFKMFALMRLESYGFHKEHCQEALEYFNGELEDALLLLYQKYMKMPTKDNKLSDYNESELLEQRVDEKGVLESIYESQFTEKMKNEVWILTFKLDYLINLYYVNKVAKKPIKNTHSHGKKPKAKCLNFMRTQTCKYGSNCRFLHKEVAKPEPVSHLNDHTFSLEIRFTKGTKYPYEPPLIFLKTDAILPYQLNLHICKRLYQEAQLLAADGIPSVYSIAELLKNEEEFINYLKTVNISFLSPNEKLFPKVIDRNLDGTKRPTHYKKGATYKDKKQTMSFNEIQREDKKLVDVFASKQKDSRYKNMQSMRNKLPAASYRSKILDTINSSQVLIISGETGCGKSTQVPQFILDEWLSTYNNKHVEIICTQPRRISAIGVAERVSEERAERIGGIVGYQIRLESKMSSSTRLSFCTTGILLRRLELDPNLSNVSHIIVDEVHERSVESDFLLLILKRLLPHRPDLKVILMSATLNANIFAKYFDNVPVLEIPGRTFPVQQIFLEEILDLTKYVFDTTSASAARGKSQDIYSEVSEVARLNLQPRPIIKDENLKYTEIVARYNESSLQACRNLYMMDPEQINIDLIENILIWIVGGDHSFPETGTILIFLPGIAEITSLYEQLCYHPIFNPKYGKYLLIPLHSSLTSAEQALVFEKPKKQGMRKIVLSTNIAETSITIDDCIFVIDGGKMKEKHFDSNRNMESLETVWVTKANALQRKGRAGRVTSGVCIHLFTSHRYKYHMQPHPIPEIHRVPLEQLLLNIKVLENFAESDLYEVLSNIIEPPVKQNIDSSILRLQNVGALDKENNLTSLGHHLATLPVDVKIGKLMLFGAIFSCIDSALTIAACLSHKNPFVSPFGQKENATAKKMTFSSAFSDQMTILIAYNKFLEVSKKSYMAGVNFAKENYLSHKTLLTIADIKFQFLELLVNIGFIPVNILERPKTGQDIVLSLTGHELNKNGGNARVISSILCAALYPNVAKVLTPEHSFIQSAAGAVPKEHEAKDFKFKTKQEQVFMHPSSVLFDVKQFSSPFIVYQEKVKTSRIYIRDCCVVPVIPLVLFSGFDINISLHNGRSFLVLDDDNWIIFEVDEHKIAEMIKLMRLELVDLLEEKIKDPLLNIFHHDTGGRVISTILQLVSNE